MVGISSQKTFGKEEHMTNKRAGIINSIELYIDQGCSKVYRFRLDNNPIEELTVAIRTEDEADTPKLYDQVLVFLHPADSKWPKHATRVIRDVPNLVIAKNS